ncbi:MAG: hypothetical protein IPJ65_11155 [Archangiaceae bacterium]|nr:hypothetical protein [Archangiaceae bacterium]
MNTHPISRLIFQSLLPSPEGFTLDPKQASKIIESLAKSAQRDDPTAVRAAYQMVGLLHYSNGAAAAQSLLVLMTSTIEAGASTSIAPWRTRA